MNTLDAFSFAADVYNCYPAEQIRFYLRPSIQPGGAQVILPCGLRVEHFGLRDLEGQPKASEQHVFAIEQREGTTICWEWGQSDPQEMLLIITRVEPDTSETALVSQARQLNAAGAQIADAGLRITVKHYAESLTALPEIYHSDDFTNRFLMLFESFWKPISRQIDQIPYYFDPSLTPTAFVPWLASWFGLTFFEGMPEARKRDLLARIFPIYAHKGTRHALILYLKMFTGGDVQIDEHRDTNFVLGKDARLGYQVALGTANQPHSFDVHVTIPKDVTLGGEEDRAQYRKQLEALIGMYKPAHTVYHLHLTFAGPLMAETETQ